MAVIVVVGVVLALRDKPETSVEETTVETTVAGAPESEKTIADVIESEETTLDETEAELTEAKKEKTTKKNKTEEETLLMGSGDAYKIAVNKYRKEIEKAVNGDMGYIYYGPYPISKESTVKFAVEDLNGDSVSELIIGVELAPGEIDVINILKYSKGTAVELFEDQIIGKRMAFEICQNGYFKLLGYSKDGNSVYTFYKYDKNSSAPYIVGSIGEYGNNGEAADIKYAKADGKLDVYEVPTKNLITEKEYNSILNQYKTLKGLEWNILYTK